jgi:hypothetical protein
MEAFLTAVTTVGFPIALTVWLLVRFDKRVAELTNAIVGREGLIDKQETIIEMQKQTIKRQDDIIATLHDLCGGKK